MPSRLQNWDNEIESVPPCRVLVQNGVAVSGEVVLTQRPRLPEMPSGIYCTPNAEAKHAKQEGPARKRKGRPAVPDPNISMNRIWEQSKLGMTAQQIADKLGCSHSTVRNRLLKYRKVNGIESTHPRSFGNHKR